MAVDSRDVGTRVRRRLLGAAGADLDTLTPPQRRLRVRDEVMAVLKEARMILPSSVVTQVVNQVSDEVVGLGPIERLLKDPEVSEVMVNGADDVYVERKGRVERVDGLVLALAYLAHLTTVPNRGAIQKAEAGLPGSTARAGREARPTRR